jgi:hypothetical protein
MGQRISRKKQEKLRIKEERYIRERQSAIDARACYLGNDFKGDIHYHDGGVLF